MGRDNVIVNRWFSQKERFADLMNGCLFQGQQIILPEQLEKIDRETDLFIPEKSGTETESGKRDTALPGCGDALGRQSRAGDPGVGESGACTLCHAGEDDDL